jgi:F0F1-type ATP synthase membrane subunit b/b'
VTKAETEAKEIVSGGINEARTTTAALLDKTNKELEAQKKVALEKLEVQIDELSQLIKEKLVGSALDR